MYCGCGDGGGGGGGGGGASGGLIPPIQFTVMLCYSYLVSCCARMSEPKRERNTSPWIT